MFYKSLIHNLNQSDPVTFDSKFETVTRLVIVLTYPGCFVGDVIKLLETLHSSTERTITNGHAVIYVVQVYSLDGVALASPSAPSLTVETHSISAYAPADIDMLIIARGSLDSVAMMPQPMLDWLQQVCPRAHRVIALGAGFFWLAAAGLLDKHQVTTIQLDSDRRLHMEGCFHTLSDCINTSDMAWLLLPDELSRHPVETLKVHQSLPESSYLTAFSAVLMRADSIVYRVCVWWLGHLDQDLSMELSAQNMCMSERNFRRHFKLEAGYSPYYFLLLLRLEMARQALVDSNLPVDKVARRGGLLDGQQLARVFRKYIGVSPQQYRENMRADYTPLSHPDYARLFNAKVQPHWLQRLLADVLVA